VTKDARFDTDLNTVVRIVFRKAESIDSLITELQEVKAYMEQYQLEAVKDD
jgi:6-phosphogluconate dehydrogenase (decarboxylating)